MLPSKVVYLVLRKPPKFYFKPGDYVFINIPAIAKYEWHPFSISSAPENSKFIWLHIRACGNWTNKLYSYSLSSKFDVSLTHGNAGGGGSPFSNNMRANMRQRMSKSLNDSNSFPLFMNDRKLMALNVMTEQDDQKDGALYNALNKKVVSFSENKNALEMNNQLMSNFKENVDTKDKVDQKATINEAISKQEGQEKATVGKLFRSLSFDNVAENKEDPSESTPKLANQQDNQSTDQSFLSANGETKLEKKSTKKCRRSQSLNCRSRKQTTSNDNLIDGDEENLGDAEDPNDAQDRRVKFKKGGGLSVDHATISLNTSRTKKPFDMEKMKQFLLTKKPISVSLKEKVMNSSIVSNIRSKQEKKVNVDKGHETLIDLEDEKV